jgi:hypothetical protein
MRVVYCFGAKGHFLLNIFNDYSQYIFFFNKLISKRNDYFFNFAINVKQLIMSFNK